MCIMLPTLSPEAFDCNVDNIGQYLLLGVALRSLMDTVDSDVEYVVLVAYAAEDRCFGDPALMAGVKAEVRRLLAGHPNVHVLLRPLFSTKCGTTILW